MKFAIRKHEIITDDASNPEVLYSIESHVRAYKTDIFDDLTLNDVALLGSMIQQLVGKEKGGKQ